MQYKIYWQTRPAPGSTLYAGMTQISVEPGHDIEDAIDAALEQVRRKDFREYSKHHLQLMKVEKV